jgi:hypothetical protein
MSEARQEHLDTFYFKNGPCCAGCDWWRSISYLSGECSKSAPMSGRDRWALLGVSGSSLHLGAGHPLTNRDHHCGDFKDEFEWSALPLAYQNRVGVSSLGRKRQE